jgi:hypothetical protein
MAIKNRRNNPYLNNNKQANYSSNTNQNANLNNNGQQRKSQGKKKNKSSAAYELSRAGSVTKRVILKLTVDHGYVKIKHSHVKISK